MIRRASVAAAALLGLLALISGCGGPSGKTPVACLSGTATYLDALRAAPAAVALSGEVPISECLTENQAAGDLATVGEAMITATVRLNGAARTSPGGKANLQLGYLIGAAKRGADRTDGIHAELLRRLIAAARYSPDNRPLSPQFLQTYGEGFDAGRSGG